MAFVAGGCSVPSVEGVEPNHVYTVSVDSTFTAEERTEVGKALDDWRTWSDGALDVELVDGHADVSIRRKPGELGAFSRVRRTIDLDPDELATYPSGLEAMTANIVGQMAGMALHDGCGVLGRDCARAEFTPADLASCRAAGFC